MNNQKPKVNSAGSLPTWGRAGVGLLFHYFKIAFRNIWKYKTQNIISTIGLAVGFACFAFSALWIKYEMSYDNFHPKADRIYRARLIDDLQTDTVNQNLTNSTAYPLADLLKSKVPEIEDACRITLDEMRLKSGKTYTYLAVDSAFSKVFDIPIESYFFQPGSGIIPMIITEQAAQSILNSTNVSGEMVESIDGKKYQIRKVIKEWPDNTDYPFNMLVALNTTRSEGELSWGYVAYHTYLLLHPGVDKKKVEDKIKVILQPNALPRMVLTPIKEQHHIEDMKKKVRFNRISFLSGTLIILCALVNYLSLSFSLVRLRNSEFALRKVNGSSNTQIIGLLLSEFLLVLFISMALSYLIIFLNTQMFKEFAMIRINGTDIFTGISFYIALTLTCILLFCILPAWYILRKELHDGITGNNIPSPKRNSFRKISLLLQLVISIGFMFCATIFFKQINYLQQTDLGFERHNIAEVSGNRWSSLKTFQYVDKIKQIPFVSDILRTSNTGYIDRMNDGTYSIETEKDGKRVTETYNTINCEPHFFDFYQIRLLKGKLFDETKDKDIVINETAAKIIGDEPIGQMIHDYQIVGIINDFYYESPAKQLSPTLMRLYDEKERSLHSFVYKYQENRRKETEESIKALIHKDYPNEELIFTYSEDAYNQYLQSAKRLFVLLGFMAVACFLIAIFGVYSLTSLTCQQRRKEIAIRKINGAEILNIMSIFFKEYFLLLALAALIAFPAGYIIMKRWLEGYVKQTSMDVWLFVLIFLVVFAVIVLTIVYMVWKAANKNPAEVVKSE